MIIKAIYRLPEKARNLLFLEVIGVAIATLLNQNEHTQKHQFLAPSEAE